MALMHSRRSDGNLSGKSGTVWTSALAWEMTESIADSMLPADATLGLTAEASPDPVNTVAVVAGVSNGGSASEPPVALFCSWWLVTSSRCGFDITILDPCIRSASSDVLLVFGGLLQPHVSCQSLGHFNFWLSLSQSLSETLSWTLKSGLRPKFNLTSV